MQVKTNVSAPCVEDTNEESLLWQMVNVVVRKRSPKAIFDFVSVR